MSPLEAIGLTVAGTLAVSAVVVGHLAPLRTVVEIAEREDGELEPTTSRLGAWLCRHGWHKMHRATRRPMVFTPGWRGHCERCGVPLARVLV